MYDITHQLMPQPASHDAEPHRCIGQRSPTLKFPPAAEVEEIVAGNRWRYHSCELADFLACISECEATAALKERVPVGASLWSGYAQ